MKTDFYVRLSYNEYKKLEEQIKNFDKLETSHVSVEGFYHKAFRLEAGSVTFEFMGPSVKEPIKYKRRSSKKKEIKL